MAVWKGSPNFNTGRSGVGIDRIVIHYIVRALAAAGGLDLRGFRRTVRTHLP